jgi:DHA3 family tetracycline resistance protein-like MFS transporter
MHAHTSRFSAYAVYLIFEGLASLSLATISTVNMVYQIEVARLNPLQLVLVGTTLETVAFVCQVPTGVLADVFSRRWAVIVGIFLVGLGFVLEGSFPRFDVILASQVVWGVGITLVDGAEQAWIAAEVGEERVGRVFLRGTQVGLIAGLLGAVISVALASIRLNLPVVSGGAGAILVAVFLLFFMPETHFHSASRQEEERRAWKEMGKTLRESLRAVRVRPMLITILLIGLFYGLYSEGVDRLSTAHLLADFTIPAIGQFKPVVWFAGIEIVSTLLALAGSEIVRRKVDTSRQRSLILTQIVLNVIGIGSLLLFALVGNFFLALATLFAFQAYRSVNGPVYTTWLTLNSDEKVRATILSMRGQIDALGQIAGGPPVGAVGTLVSLRAALVTSCAILSPVLLLFAYAFRRVGKQTPVNDIAGEEEIAPVP